MSEFTVGTLFLSRDLEAVETALKESQLPFLILRVNPAWSAFLTPDEWLMLPETRAAVRKVSVIAPLLHFSSAEDHGWNFSLYYNGQEQAAFRESYPWDPFLSLLDEDEEPAPPQAPPAEALMYFRLFDLEQAAVDALGALLAEPQAEAGRPDARVEGFKRLLGIPDLAWVSYRHAARRQAE